MALNLLPGDTLVRVHIRVHEDNRDELMDALTTTLNDLAREDVLNDDDDDAWEYVPATREHI